MNIIGWGKIIPQLAAFFAVLKRRPNHLTPFNLFVSGRPGTNKTEGFEWLAKLLGYLVGLIDTSTLDDVSELAGVVDLHANRESGEAKVIEGELLKSDILILDEFLNCRPHVLPQFRLMLQGHLVLMGKKMPMTVRAIVGTGNLSTEMDAGEANHLDSPTADRFAMVVRVPTLSEMTPAEQEAILEGRGNTAFADEFRKAVSSIDKTFEATERELGSHATRYVRALSGALADTPCAFEGRRGKLLRSFVIAGLALCRAEPKRKVKEVLWAIAHDVLTYHRLSGIEVDLAALKAAHESAYKAMGKTGIEDLIAQEPTLAGKIGLMVAHLSGVSPVTKVDLLGHIVSGTDVSLKVAAKELVKSAKFAGQPAELRALIERTGLPLKKGGVLLSPESLVRYATMSQAEQLAWEICEGDETKTAELLAKVREHLNAWGVVGKN